MPLPSIPSSAVRSRIAKKASQALESLTVENDDGLLPVCCSVCDRCPTKPFWYDWVSIAVFRRMCSFKYMEHNWLKRSYLENVLSCYRIDDPRLSHLVLSPKTIMDKRKKNIVVCKTCLQHLKNQLENVQKSRRVPPPNAVANGFIIGEPPEELKCLNLVEMSIVSANRVMCQSWVFYGGCHRHIEGWHTMYRNRSEVTMANLNQLSLAGMKGQLFVALCGPFTSDQKAKVLQKCRIRAPKVIAAFEWLKNNNYLYEDLIVPSINDLPVPIIDSSTM